MKLSGGVPPSARLISPDSLAEFDQILAGHLVIDPERQPAHGPIGLPLQLAAPAGDQGGDALAAFRILVGDGAGRGVVRHDRHLQHDAGARADRQKGRIGLRPLGPQRRQHDGHHGIEAREHAQQRGVEAAGAVALGRGQELVFEPEGVEKGAQARIVVGPEARMGAERIGHLRERLAQMLRHQRLVGDVVGHLAQPVEVIREGDEPGLDLVVGEHPERMAHHGGAGDLSEGPDMRQARGPVAGLEDDGVLVGILGVALQPRHDPPRLLERPGIRALGELAQIGGWGFGHRHGRS